MPTTQITWTRTEAGRYEHAESGIEIRQGESGKWLVYSPMYRTNPQVLVTSRATLAQAKVVAKEVAHRDLTRRETAHAEALQIGADRIVAQAERVPTGIAVTRDERTVDLSITTTEEITSFRGTAFVPNRVMVLLSSGEVISVSLERVTDDGWGIDDPAGPDGAELNVSYGGGELAADRRARLPQVAQDILAHIETGKA